MSKQNAKTLEAYNQTAKQYMANSIEHDNLDPAKAQRKRAKLNDFIQQSFATLPKHARVFEIGSADGKNAKFLQSLGYDVTASDVAPDFLATIKQQGFEPLKFDVLNDEFPQTYHGIFCWRVFVHFTSEDFLVALKKTYAALEPGGRLIFNVFNREDRGVDYEWTDFPGEYRMGVDRYFNYFRDSEIRDLIAQTGYSIAHFHREGGDSGNKWLVFVLEK